MGASSEYHIKLSEEEYLQIPPEVRSSHLQEKIISFQLNDFEELMKDAHYKKLYKEKKTITKALSDWTLHLREQKRKQLISK